MKLDSFYQYLVYRTDIEADQLTKQLQDKFYNINSINGKDHVLNEILFIFLAQTILIHDKKFFRHINNSIIVVLWGIIVQMVVK